MLIQQMNPAWRVNDLKSSASSLWVDLDPESHRGICHRDLETCRTIPRRLGETPVHFLEGLGNLRWNLKIFGIRPIIKQKSLEYAKHWEIHGDISLQNRVQQQLSGCEMTWPKKCKRYWLAGDCLAISGFSSQVKSCGLPSNPSWSIPFYKHRSRSYHTTI